MLLVQSQSLFARRPPRVVRAEVPEFSASRTSIPGAVRVKLAGELDLATVPIAEHELRQAQGDALQVLLDLRGLTFIGVAGLHMVAAANVRARHAGGRLLVDPGSTCVRRLFHVTHADRSLDIADGMAVAPAAHNGSGPTPG